MAVDVATLAVKVDTTDLQDGSAALNKLTADGMKAEKSMQGVGRAATSAGNASRISANNLRMVGMQLGQVSQQGAVTGNYLQALTVQMGDILPFLGITGLAGVAATAAGALIPLAAAFIDTSSSAERMEDALDGLTDSTRAYRAAVEASKIEELAAKFGNVTAEVIELQRRIRELRMDDMLRSAQSAVDELASSFERSFFYTQLQNIIGGLEMSVEQAETFEATLRRLGRESSLEGQVAIIREMQNQIVAAAGGVENMTTEQREFYDQTVDAEAALREAAAAADGTARAVGGAADEASRLAGNLEDAARALSSLQSAVGSLEIGNIGRRAELAALQGGSSKSAASIEGKLASKRAELAGFLGSEAAKQQVAAYEAALREEAALVDQIGILTKPAKGGRGGGGTSEAQKLHNERMREAERIYASTRTAAEEYAAELADLNELLNLGYINADTYARAVDKIEEAYRNADEAARFFDQVQQNFEEGFVDAIVSGQSLTQVFHDLAAAIAKAALQAALFGTGPMAGLFGGSGSGLLGGITGSLFSFDGGGYTGTGSRSGGMDGKGGFMAMLHPDETVVDHKKQGSTGGGSNNVAVNAIIVQDETQARNYMRSPRGEQDVRNILINLGVI